METIKTALVVILLLVVLFGVYTVLNKPDPQPPREVAWVASSGPSPLSLDISMGGDASSPGSPAPGSISPFPGPAAPPSTPFSPPSATPATPTTQPAWPPSELKRDESPRGGGENASDSQVRASNASTFPGLPTNEAPIRGAGTAIPPPDLMLPTRVGDGSVVGPRTAQPAMPTIPAMPTESGRTPPPPAGDSPLGRSSEPAAPERRTEFGDAADAVSGTRHSLADRGPQMQTNPYFSESPAKASGDKSLAGQNAGGPGDDPLANNPQATQAGVSLYSKGANFDRELRAAQSLVEGRQWREALLSLSQLCQEPNLSTAQQSRLYDLLDPLAAKVIYSTEHLIEGPYTVQRGETLKSIGQQFNVPWELLRNINAVRNPDVLVPGSTLKVVRGPFRADVDLAAREMTLYAEQLYAGRFPISVGSEPSPHPGEYEVRAKELGRTFYGRDGQSLAATDPRNPYGQRLLDLGREVSIHGSPEVDGGAAAQGCVGLSPRDAEDVFAILSHGSKVSIRR